MGVEGQRTVFLLIMVHGIGSLIFLRLSEPLLCDRCAFLTVRSTRFAGRSSGLGVELVSMGVWFVVAGTGWRFRGMAPEDFTRSL